MWFDELGADKSWTALWSGYIICGRCTGIRKISGECPVCRERIQTTEPRRVFLDNGQELLVHQQIFPGAEGRYEDWVYLQMLEREWKRPVLEGDYVSSFPQGQGPSPRASIVLLFWSYFESRMERLLRAALRNVPSHFLEDALRRYSSIGSRLDSFYRLAFGTTYQSDLEEVGYPQVWAYLSTVKQRRNAFAHGQPQAIDDALVGYVIEMLKIVHEAWIAVFNRRAARS